MTWQEFDIAMTFPEAYYDQRHYWFKIDDYSTSSNVSVPGKIYYCSGCEEQKTLEQFKQATFTESGNGYPAYCIGCAHNAALKKTYHFSNYEDLDTYQNYALASAVYCYDSTLQFMQPHHDICEFIKKCASLAYKDYGKVISHYGALRVTVQQVSDYACNGKAKQLSWDRAYNSEGELCYICYYDGGNAAYGGFMRALLTPEERKQLFNVVDVKEELLGDTLELATRYPQYFQNWGGPKTTNACIRGIERSFWVYANAQDVRLVTALVPRKRRPPGRQQEIVDFIASMTDVLCTDFVAIMDSDVLPPVSGEVTSGYDRMVDEAVDGAEVAPPVQEPADEYEEELAEGTASNLEALHQKLKARIVENLTVLQSGQADMGEENRVLTFCVACGDPRHCVTECPNDPERVAAVTKGLEIMVHAMLDYPNMVTAPTTTTDQATAGSSRPSQMEVDEAGSNASSGRRPKAKARPRQRSTRVPQEWRLIMNDNLHLLAQDVGHRRGKYLVCGVRICDEGPESEEKAMEIIEERSSHRDRRLPQRGDAPAYSDNEAYRCMGRNVRGGILDLLPYNGVRFFHEKWDATNHTVLRDLNRRRINEVKWVGRAIQMDLRHHLARPPRTISLDKYNRDKYEGIIRCDEGGWVHIEDLLGNDAIWCHWSRNLSPPAHGRDAEQRKRIYNDRMQMLFDANTVNADKNHGGKIRMQFLGLRLKEPPVPLADPGYPGADAVVSLPVQVQEMQGNNQTARNQQWIGVCDGWVMPWAVRATSGQSVPTRREHYLVPLDPDKFAISPSLELCGILGGGYHATSHENLLSIMEHGISPGAAWSGYNQRDDTGRVHSYFGIYAPWDPRNVRVSGRDRAHKPLVVLYVPINELVRMGGRITDSSNILLSRNVPFSLVKEVWFCAPNQNDNHSFEYVEKIYDEELVYEMVLSYKPSPILHYYTGACTPAVVMDHLVDMSEEMNPNSRDRDQHFCNLARAADMHPQDARRLHYINEAIKFVIKHSRPNRRRFGDTVNGLQMRICPACFRTTPSCLTRCTTCWSTFVSHGRFQQAAQRETPLEVPDAVEHSMAAASAAVPIVIEEDAPPTIDLTEAASVAEPEGEAGQASQDMEMDQQTVGEPEPDEEMMGSDEEEEQGEVAERRPLITSSKLDDINPALEIARASMNPHLHSNMGTGTCVDVNPISSAYMAYVICHTMYKNWNTMAQWVTMPYDTMQQRFAHGQRYDFLGKWPELCAIDNETHVSKDLSDEEILTVLRARAAERNDRDDPEGKWMLRRIRANQVLSMLTRGAILMGYNREDFNATHHVDSRVDPGQMHFVFYGILNRLIPVLTGFSNYSVLRPIVRKEQYFFVIDAVGVLMNSSTEDASPQAIAMLVDHNILLPRKFIDKLTKYRATVADHPQLLRGQKALKHIERGDYLAAGQTSILDQPLNEDERAGVGRPSQGDDRPHHNANTMADKGDGKRKTPQQREQDRQKAGRWAREFNR